MHQETWIANSGLRGRQRHDGVEGLDPRLHAGRRAADAADDPLSAESPESIQYTKVARVDDGIPFVLETAFGWRGDDAPDQRLILAGANWSAGIRNPFRSFGSTGARLESMLAEFRAGPAEPIVFVARLAHPRVEYTDRGRTTLVLGE